MESSKVVFVFQNFFFSIFNFASISQKLVQNDSSIFLSMSQDFHENWYIT